MNAKAAYLDTSAFVKLIVEEPESKALKEYLLSWPNRVSSTLLRTETTRALRHSGNDKLIGKSRRMFGAVHLIRLDETLLDRAGDLEPVESRSLDAIHLATALSISSDLGVLFTYDDRLGEAAVSQGLYVESPS